MIQKHLKIKGRVQGVGYRYFTVQQARELNIKGWVKNNWNGSVETVLHGSADNIEEMIKRLWKGPAAARVTEINELSVYEESENFHDFSVRR